MIWINLSCALKCAGMLIMCIMYSMSLKVMNYLKTTNKREREKENYIAL